MENSPVTQNASKELEQRKSFSERLDSTLKEIESLVTAPDEEVLTFVNTRLEKLESKAGKPIELSAFSNPIHEGYVSKETGIRRNMLVEPMYLDDPSLYKDFIDTYKEFKNNESWAAMPPRQIMIGAVQYALQKYFGSMFSSSGTEMKNREFYLDKSTAEEKISLADFKGKKMAVCAEKSTAAQNLLSFVGMDSCVILSGDCKLAGEESGEGHVFNVFNSGIGYRLYDPTNPSLVMDKDKKITSVAPAIYAISDDDFKKLITKQEVVVDHVDFQVDESGNRDTITTKRVYGGVLKK